MDAKDKEIAQLKAKLEKAERFAQTIIPGFEGSLLTSLQYQFAVIRGRYPKKDANGNAYPDWWCLKEAGSSANQATLRKLASTYMAIPAVKQIVDSERAKQAEVLRLNGDYVLGEVIELGKMCMGKLPIASTVVDDDGKVHVKQNIVFNPAGAGKALELLGKHQKLWTDKVEATGADGAPLAVAREVVYVNKDNVGELVSNGDTTTAES